MVLSPLVQVKSHKDLEIRHQRTIMRHAVVHVSVTTSLLSPHLLWPRLTLTVLCYTVASCANSVSHSVSCSLNKLPSIMPVHLWVRPPQLQGADEAFLPAVCPTCYPAAPLHTLGLRISEYGKKIWPLAAVERIASGKRKGMVHGNTLITCSHYRQTHLVCHSWNCYVVWYFVKHIHYVLTQVIEI